MKRFSDFETFCAPCTINKAYLKKDFRGALGWYRINFHFTLTTYSHKTYVDRRRFLFVFQTCKFTGVLIFRARLHSCFCLPWLLTNSWSKGLSNKTLPHFSLRKTAIISTFFFWKANMAQNILGWRGSQFVQMKAHAPFQR